MNVSLKCCDWIPMNENHPPKIRSQLLITYKHYHIVEKQMSTAIYLGDNIWELPDGFRFKSTNYTSDYAPFSVLAWMSLPKPY